MLVYVVNLNTIDIRRVLRSTCPIRKTSKMGHSCRIHPHVFSFAVQTTREPDFKKQLTRRLKGEGGNSKKDVRHTRYLVEEYAALLTKARLELLVHLRTPAVSDVQAAVEAAFQVGLPCEPILWLANHL